MRSVSPRARAWIELIRLPNLFTVPGDPLAGFFLAGSLAMKDVDISRAIFPAIAALFIYVGGLIGNDVADQEEDRRDRPQRPIPSGRVSRTTAFAASAVIAALGLAIASCAGFPVFTEACLTQLAVMAYNGRLKRHAISGAIAMGACRGLSFLMGVAAACPRLLGDMSVVVAAIGVTAYIAGITWIADRETSEEYIGLRRWTPLLSLTICLPLVRALAGKAAVPFAVLGLMAVGWAFYQGGRLKGIPAKQVLGSAIGSLIRGLLLIQAAFCSLGGAAGLAVAAALLVLWPLSAAVAKRFYAT